MIAVSHAADGGKALVLLVEGARGKVQAQLDREFLDDAVGQESTEDDRRTYVRDHSSELENAINATAFGGILNTRFKGIEILKIEKSEAK